MILYKYRGFSNFEFALDIFVNNRLYAADFQSLNDPMEGRFVYDTKSMDKERVKRIIGEKSNYGIVALSEKPNNHLLWSYYAEGHSGFVVGVEIVDSQDVSINKIEYVDNFEINNLEEERYAEKILLRKHSTWAHESEYRVLKRCHNLNERFIKVQIKELIFRPIADYKQKTRKEILVSIARKFCPDIVIKSISEDEIEKGLL